MHIIKRLARSVRGRIALHAAAVLFLLGICLPVFSLNRFGVFTDTYSIVTAAIAQLREGSLLIFLAITLFSIVLPAVKIAWLYKAEYSQDDAWRRRTKHALGKLGKWSMLDVFIVAVLVASLKSSMFASIDVHVGLYAFAASVLLTMVATRRVDVSAADEDTQP